MSPSRLFILRPVATTLLMVGLLLVGLVAYTQLPVPSRKLTIPPFRWSRFIRAPTRM